jgi:hypothetical protein
VLDQGGGTGGRECLEGVQAGGTVVEGQELGAQLVALIGSGRALLLDERDEIGEAGILGA